VLLAVGASAWIDEIETQRSLRAEATCGASRSSRDGKRVVTASDNKTARLALATVSARMTGLPQQQRWRDVRA
jgi:hypothetical protein